MSGVPASTFRSSIERALRALISGALRSNLIEVPNRPLKDPVIESYA